MNRLTYSVARSLQSKLLLPLVLFGAVLATATVWGIYARFQRHLGERVRMRAELVANAVNYAAEISPRRELQRIVSAIGAEEEVSLIVVAGGRPARILAATRNAWLGQALTELPATEVAEDLDQTIQTRQSHYHLHLGTAQFHFTSPLFLSQPELADRSLTNGAVMVHLDLQTTEAAIRQLTIEFSATFLAALALSAAFGYGLLQYFVLRPVARIGQLVEHRREGAGESWAAIATDDELGVLAGTLHDSLTRTDAALETVRASQDYLTKLINTIGDPVLVKDAQHRLVLVNDAECALAGRAREELLGKTDYDFFPKEQVDIFWKTDDRVLETGEDILHEETLTDACTGKLRTISTRKTRYVDPAGNRFVVAVIRDTTERKRTDEALRRSETQFRSVWERSGDGMRLTDGQGIVVLVNQAYCEMTGKTRSEIEGRSMAEIYAADQRLHVHQMFLERYARRAFTPYAERKLRLWNGEEVWLAVSTAMLDPDEPVPKVLDVYRNISARKQEEAERERLVAELQGALANVKSLRGLLPICAGCKKIRDDKNYWHQVDSYIAKHTDATFTHGMCPDCIKKWYPDLAKVLPPTQ